MARVMGLDIGDRTIGVALSDPFFLTAQGRETIRRQSNKKDLAALLQIIQEEEVCKIVVGLPKNMDNSLGPQAEKVMEFVAKLKGKTTLDIVYQDERLTTVSAERLLIEGNVRRKKRKTVIDKVAATFILQAFLDQEAHRDGVDRTIR